MSAVDTSLEGLLPSIGASKLPNRLSEFVRLSQCAEEARKRREGRRELGLPSPAVLFLSMTRECDFSCNRCSTARYPWDAVPSPDAANRALSEAERYGVTYCVLTGCKRWLNEDLFDVLRVHDRQVFLLMAQPSEFGKETVQQLAELPHVLPFLFAVDPGAGCCSGTDLSPTQGAIAALHARGVSFGFAAGASVQSLPYLTGVEFYDDCVRAGATSGVVLDCMSHRGKGEMHTPLGVAERLDLAAHLARTRERLGVFIAYLPWEESYEGWCVGATTPTSSHIGGETPFELLHVAPSHPPSEPAMLPEQVTFDSLRVAILGDSVEPPRPATPAKKPRRRSRE